MTKKKSPFLFALFFLLTLFVTASLLANVSAPMPSSTIRVQPQRDLAPLPLNYAGVGLSIDVTDSVNGWQAWNLLANNTMADSAHRNATFSRGSVNGFALAWQNLTISQLTATNDTRAVQGGGTWNDYLRARQSASSNQKLAMRFTCPDRANLMGVWMYYALTGSSVPFSIGVTAANTSTPTGVSIVGGGTVPTTPGGVEGWYYVPLSSPVTLTSGNYYWLIVDASALNSGGFDWYCIYDSPMGFDDSLFGSAYRTLVGLWLNETQMIGAGWISYNFNFMLVLKVLPVGSDNKAMKYSSPRQVGMYLNSTANLVNATTTRISNSYTAFTLCANTSIMFMANWTARFESLRNGMVTTTYRAFEGVTFWNTSFQSDTEPIGVPKTVYNRTLTISPISAYWNLTRPASNVTNTNKINFTVGWAYAQGYVLITQTDDVNKTTTWNANWNIIARSLYAISASAPAKVIQGQTFNVTASATVLPSTRIILVLDRSDNILYNKTFFVSSSPYYHQLRLNATGDNNIILVDRGVSQNEASFFNVSWVSVLRALTQMNLESQTISATWGDQIHVRINYENATNGVKLFPSSPLPSFSIGGYIIPVVTNEGGGWYSFNYPSSLQPAAGSHSLSVSANYVGTYANVTTLNLNLAKINMTLSIVMDQTSVSADSSLTVSGQLTFRNGTKVPDGFNVRFDFFVTWQNGTQSTVTKYEAISNGTATASILALDGMKSITVTVTYEGNSILQEVADTRQNIPVTAPQGLPIPLLLGIGVGGALVVIIPLAVIVKRRKSRETETRKTSVLRQTASLAQLIVVDLRSGLSVFSRSIGSEESVEPNLISGFLKANQEIIGEVFKKQTGAGLRFADYGEYKVISNVGNHIMATLFATETAGAELKDVLQKFTEKFERKYGKALESWDGDTSTFEDADEIADEVFCLPLTAPHMLLEVPTAQLSKLERAAVQSARILSEGRGIFFMPQVIDFLLTKQGLRRGKAMDVINSLTSKGVFRQLTIEQAAQVVKSCAEKSATQS